MRPLFLLVASLLIAGSSQIQAQVRAVATKQTPAAEDGFGSPAVDAGDYLYVSAQGPRRQDGSVPTNFADQIRQSLQNIKSVVEAAGLTMDHVVPIVRGGRSTKGNVVPSCKDCNSKKKHRLAWEE